MAISIKVDEAVQEWMKKKGRTIITVSLRATRTCCVGAVDVDISYKKPQNNNYMLILNLNPKTEHSKKECCKFSGYFYAKFSVYSI